MSLQCYLCEYKTSHIKYICQHLRNIHTLFEGSNLILKCCSGCKDCPAIFRTYCGLTKHLKKCFLQRKDEFSSNNNNQISDIENSENF